MTDSLILKGQVLTFTHDPFSVEPSSAAAVVETSGALWTDEGIIQYIGPSDHLPAESRDVPVHDYGDSLIVAGFVDCHVHYPQLPIIASYGEQLLDWLEKYTFPMESAFYDTKFAREVSDLFLKECLKNGTTTSAVYATVHPESVNAFFEATTERNLRMACGKVLMDRNAPEDIRDSAKDGYDQSKRLIDRWHGKGRNIYAITPRFAVTSTPEQLDAAGVLWKNYPDVLMQTHLSENRGEIDWVLKLFPDAPDYFAVYEKFGLAGPGALFGHGIHLSPRERDGIFSTGSAIAHCPTSNAFIGSGLFDLQGLREGRHSINIGLATDVAGGSSLSMFATMRAAYEIAQLRGYNLHPAKAWYLASAGAARAMNLHHQVGNLALGMEADVTVIDLKSTAIIESRVSQADDIWDVLFAQIILADDRAIKATYAAGNLVYKASSVSN